jgi:predicted transcriptional regulator
MQTITISLPDKVYQRLQHAAASAGKAEHELAAQSVQESLPPLMDTIPVRYRDELRAMEKLANGELGAIARSTVDEKLQKKLRRLLKKNSLDTITKSERELMAELSSLTDQVMLKKAYALLLLKWRGQRIPSLAEFENEA